MAIKHLLPEPRPPQRVVILGATGFLGKNTIPLLRDAALNVLALGSADINLVAPTSTEELSCILREDDSLLFLSAITPDKGRDTRAFMQNISMGANVALALKQRPVSHVVYLSSDAVYAFDGGLVSERTPAAPADLYGVMHRARELMLLQAANNLLIVRSTMLFGAADTHNSYGANRFRRQARKDLRVSLAGHGEETRDHVYVADAARLICHMLYRKSTGLINLVSGMSISFLELAQLVAAQFSQNIEIGFTERQQPITHRHFENYDLIAAFPNFRFTSLPVAIAETHSSTANGRAD